MQFVANLDEKKLGKYKEELITREVILTDERLNEHILIRHKKEYNELKTYIKDIIEKPDYIIEDNRHKETLIYLKYIKDIDKNGRIVVKLAIRTDEEHCKNSIITLMQLNERTLKQTITNRGKIIWKARQE